MAKSIAKYSLLLWIALPVSAQTPPVVPTPQAPVQRPPVPPVAAMPAPAAPWKTLFDGKTVTGLRGVQKPDFLKAGWKIDGGALVLPKEIRDSGKVTGGDLVTTEAYTDFEFVFEWKVSVAGNSGVLYLARAAAGQKPVGHEFQIIDDVRHPDGLKGGPAKRSGALYGVVPPSENKQLNDNEWNEGLLRVRGNHVEHWVNRQKVLEYELGTADLQRAMQAASKTRLLAGTGTKFKAPIVLLDQGDEVAFRHLRIRPIAPVAPAAPTLPVPAVAQPLR